jgi:hypothetical protein
MDKALYRSWIANLGYPTCLVLAIGFCASTSLAGTINVTGIEPSNWAVWGAGASDATPFEVNNHLTITNNQTETGTFLPGGTLGSFDGFWYAEDTFSLPADATSVALSFSSFQSDDRAVLELNGVIIGNSSNGEGVGSMQFTDGGGLQSFDFTTSGGSGTITTGFVAGGANTLEVIVNNTGDGIVGATQTFQATSDKTFFKLNGTVTYTDGPEPSTMILAAFGSAALLFKARRKRPGAPKVCRAQ